MGSLSTYAENAILNHVLKVTAFAQPTNLYVAISTTDPTVAGTGITEPVGNGYARVLCNTWKTAAARLISNSGTIAFPEATGAWGTIGYYATFDAATGGNMISYGSLAATKTIGFGDNASFQDGSIAVSFNTGGISTYLANAILDHIFKNTAYAVPTNVCVAVSSTNPTDTATGITEPVGNAYARVTFNTWNTSTTGASSNNGAITFPQANPAGWGTIAYQATFDAATAGNMLFYAALDVARNIGQLDTPSFGNGTLNLTIH